MTIDRKVSSIESSFKMENMKFDEESRTRVKEVLSGKIVISDAIAELNKKYFVSTVKRERPRDIYYKNDNDKKYCYLGTNILKNKLNIREFDLLCNAERDYSAVRQAELDLKGVTGDFSIKHLCSIHKHIFQDIYTWAGKIRTVDISKETVFCLIQYIEAQSEGLFNKLKKEKCLVDITDKKYMASRLAYYFGEINMIHPFREGNGRTQRIYIEQLCKNNGNFEIDFTEITQEEMLYASIQSAKFNNDLMEKLIFKCLIEI